MWQVGQGDRGCVYTVHYAEMNKQVEQIVEDVTVYKTHTVASRWVSTTLFIVVIDESISNHCVAWQHYMSYVSCKNSLVTAIVWKWYCSYIPVLTALVTFYSAVDPLRSVRIFNLCGPIQVVADTVASTDVRFIVSHFSLKAWILPSFLDNLSYVALRKIA